MTEQYGKWSKEELIAEMKRMKKRKKFGLVWEDKPEDVAELCKTKLPVLVDIEKKEISENPHGPTNILIEGDNYHALSVLNYTHKDKIDVIYIDPPYNTGNASWRYNNKIVDAEDSFKHSKFISFLERRLKLAKSLLSPKGILVLTIDDYEIHTCRLLLDEIFGENNRLGTVVIVHNPRGRNDDRYFATMHEYALFYAKNAQFAEIKKFEFNDESLLEQFPHKDSISRYGIVSFMRTGNNSDRHTRPNLFYPIYWNGKTLSLKRTDDAVKILPINEKGEEKTWRWSQETFLERIKTDILVKSVKEKIRLFKKRRPEIVGGTKPKTLWYDPRYDASSHGVVLLDRLFKRRGIFPYPKSLYAVLDTLKIASYKDSIVLDFFAGSGTTGHAVLLLNKEDKGERRFILCTNNENKIAEDVCYPRIKQVIKGNKDYSYITGIPANLKYFRTDFVNADPTDKNKKNLTEKATAMLCIKEGTFEKMMNKKVFKIYKNNNHYTGIIFDQMAIPAFKEAIAKLKGKFSIYIFSLSDDSFEDEFEDVKQKVKISPIPEVILRVYRRIFK
ncbi:MAG: site-specific DNA-methyltransferase [bacterium]|nr:site-specific DNA-methyltransferase [bacterium]